MIEEKSIAIVMQLWYNSYVDMSLNKIVFALLLSTLIVFGFNLFFLQNNIDTFVNRQVIQSTKHELMRIDAGLAEYFDQQSDLIGSLSRIAILQALEKRQFTTADIALIQRSTQTILENSAAIQFIRIIDSTNYQLLYSTNATDVVEVSTETIQYQPFTSLATPIEDLLLNTANTKPQLNNNSAPVYFVQIDGVNNRLLLAVPLTTNNDEHSLLAVSYHAIDRLQSELPNISDFVRRFVGVDNGIIVNPLPSIDYQKSVTEPVASHTSIQLSDGTQYVAIAEETPSALTLYAFISQQQLVVGPIANLIVLCAIGSMLFVIMLFVMNISQGNEVYIKNQLSIFRKKLLYLAKESPDLRDFELLNRLTLQRETLYEKIITNLKGSDENNRKLFNAGWQRLLATLQFDGVLDESSVHKQFHERYPSNAPQSNSVRLHQSKSAIPSNTSDVPDIPQSVVSQSTTDTAAVPAIDSVAEVEDVVPLEVIEPKPEQGELVQPEKPISHSNRSTNLSRDTSHVQPEKLPIPRYIAPQTATINLPSPGNNVVRTKGLLYKALIKSIRPITQRDGIMQISQLLISDQRNQSTKVYDKELGELIDTLSAS